MGMKSCPNQLVVPDPRQKGRIARKNGASVLLAHGLIFNCQVASERSLKNFKGFNCLRGRIRARVECSIGLIEVSFRNLLH